MFDPFADDSGPRAHGAASDDAGWAPPPMSHYDVPHAEEPDDEEPYDQPAYAEPAYGQSAFEEPTVSQAVASPPPPPPPFEPLPCRRRRSRGGVAVRPCSRPRGRVACRERPRDRPRPTSKSTTIVRTASSSGSNATTATLPKPTTVGTSNGTTEPVAAVAATLAPSVVQIETSQGLGSGFIYDSAGHILTAAHVVSGAGDTVTVRLADGTAQTGTVVGADASTDVAVIKINLSGTKAKIANLAVGDAPRSVRPRSRSGARSASSRPSPRASSARSTGRCRRPPAPNTRPPRNGPICRHFIPSSSAGLTSGTAALHSKGIIRSARAATDDSNRCLMIFVLPYRSQGGAYRTASAASTTGAMTPVLFRSVRFENSWQLNYRSFLQTKCRWNLKVPGTIDVPARLCGAHARVRNDHRPWVAKSRRARQDPINPNRLRRSRRRTSRVAFSTVWERV